MPITAHVYNINTKTWQDFTDPTLLNIRIDGLRKSKILLYLDYIRGTEPNLSITWRVYEALVDNGFYDVVDIVGGTITESQYTLDHTAKVRVPLDIISGEDICEVTFDLNGGNGTLDAFVVQKLKLR